VLFVGSSLTKGYVEPSHAPTRAGAIVSSPLILGMNLSDSHAMDISWPVVTNKEVVAVNQQYAGHPGKLVREYYPAPGTDGPALGKFAWAMPCNGSDPAQIGWSADAAASRIKVGGLCLEKASDDSVALMPCSSGFSDDDKQKFALDATTGALVHGDFVPPPPPPPPPPPGKKHSTCAALTNHTSTVRSVVTITVHNLSTRCATMSLCFLVASAPLSGASRLACLLWQRCACMRCRLVGKLSTPTPTRTVAASR